MKLQLASVAVSKDMTISGKVGNTDHVFCTKWPSNLHTMRRKENRIEQPRKRKSAKKWVKIRLRLASTVVISLKKNPSQKIYGCSLFWHLQEESCYLFTSFKAFKKLGCSKKLEKRVCNQAIVISTVSSRNWRILGPRKIPPIAKSANFEANR